MSFQVGEEAWARFVEQFPPPLKERLVANYGVQKIEVNNSRSHQNRNPRYRKAQLPFTMFIDLKFSKSLHVFDSEIQGKRESTHFDKCLKPTARYPGFLPLWPPEVSNHGSRTTVANEHTGIFRTCLYGAYLRSRTPAGYIPKNVKQTISKGETCFLVILLVLLFMVCCTWSNLKFLEKRPKREHRGVLADCMLA